MQNASFPLLLAARPIGLAEELAAMPQTYQAMVGDVGGAIKDYYAREIAAYGGIAPSPRESVDDHARALIRTRFAGSDYHYGYYEGRDTQGRPEGVYVRTVGIYPCWENWAEEDIRGTIVDLRGYGNTLEHDLERTADFLGSGYAVFTPERLEHGLSSRIDPRNASLQSTRVFVEHTRQAIEIAKTIRARDPRLSSKPLYAIGSSLGGALLVGAMAGVDSNLGIQAMVLDNPLLTFGLKHPWWHRRVLSVLFGALSAFPKTLSEVKTFYPRRSPSERPSGMSNEMHDRLSRYRQAFGPVYHPIVLRDLEDLLDGNRRWLIERGSAVLPRLMMTVASGDAEVSPVGNADLYSGFARPDDDIRPSMAHHSFLLRNDPTLVPDITRFFERLE
jgi:hypothetical protein